VPAQNFNPGDKLYIDWVLQIAAGNVGTLNITLFENGGAAEEVITPGYGPIPGVSPGSGDNYYDYLDHGIKVNKPRGLPWHPYYLGVNAAPPEVLQVSINPLPTGLAFDGQRADRPIVQARVNQGGSSERHFPFEAAPAVWLPQFSPTITLAPSSMQVSRSRLSEPPTVNPPLLLVDPSSFSFFQSQNPDRPVSIARRQTQEHDQQSLIIGGPDPVSFSPLVWDVPAQIPGRGSGPRVAPFDASPNLLGIITDAASRMDWLERSTTPARYPSRLPIHRPSPAAVPLPDPQEALTGAALFPQPATLVRQTYVREAEQVWERPPIVEGSLYAWLPPSQESRPVHTARAQQPQTDLPANFSIQVAPPFPWLQDQQPTAYPWKLPKPAAQIVGFQSDPIPAANMLIVVNGPYFVVAAQIYCPGAVAGDIQTQ
jgi:hypothetical protein